MDEGRKFLEEQVRTKADKREASSLRLTAAFAEYSTATSDLLAFQKALEAYTRGTASPYYPPPLDNPLDALLSAEQSFAPSGRREDAPPKQERVSKRSIILETLANSNGNGLKVRELHAKIPEDAPIKIALEDLYRALPSLKKHDKIWQDKFGRYHLGSRPANADSLFNESPEGFFEETAENAV
jgi:hypothetical protein